MNLMGIANNKHERDEKKNEDNKLRVYNKSGNKTYSGANITNN